MCIHVWRLQLELKLESNCHFNIKLSYTWVTLPSKTMETNTWLKLPSGRWELSWVLFEGQALGISDILFSFFGKSCSLLWSQLYTCNIVWRQIFTRTIFSFQMWKIQKMARWRTINKEMEKREKQKEKEKRTLRRPI